MDHVINDLRKWLDIYQETEPDNKKAIKCIENALDELYKYYPQTKDEYGNPLDGTEAKDMIVDKKEKVQKVIKNGMRQNGEVLKKLSEY